MTITHQKIEIVYHVTATGTGEDERNEADDYLRSLGYVRSLWVDGDDWSMNFVRTEVVADTARGDEVRLDGRWEAKE